MASNRARATTSVGTRLNDMSAKIEEQQAKSRGNSTDDITARLDAIEDLQKLLASPNYRIEQESQYLIDAFPILAGGSSGQPIGPATESVSGVAKLSTFDEAILAPGQTSTIMTPQRVLDSISTFAPVASRGQTSRYSSDFNTEVRSGFYWGSTGGDTLNLPPGNANSSYIGLVHSGDVKGLDGSGAGYIVQDIYEINSFGTLIQRWNRVGSASGVRTWSPWVTATVSAATTTAPGVIQLATNAEATSGTDTTKAVTPSGLKAVADTKAALSHTHTSTQITDFTSAVDARVAAGVPYATTTAAGKVELATIAETTTGTDSTLAVTPAGVKSVADTKAELDHTHTSTQITDFGTATDGRINTLVPLASETVAGKARLATTNEARLAPDSDFTTTVLTPQRASEILEWYAPAVDMRRTSKYVDDWNTTTEVGFYKSFSDSLNSPISGKIFIGLVHSAYTYGWEGNGAGPILQDVAEVKYDSVSASYVLVQRWTRVRDEGGTWGNWVSDTSDENQRGLVELATLIETTTGTDTTRAVTPAGVKAVADTKAALNHTHTIDQIPVAAPGASSSTDVLRSDDPTVAATANRVVRRDASGRAKIATPSASDDIATKGYVDSAIGSGGDFYVEYSPELTSGSGTSVDPLLISAPIRLQNTGRGTTAQRDAYYGVPTTDAQRVALANRCVEWFNTDLGWYEVFLVATGTSGLTVRGTVAGTSPGWYPAAGSLLTCTRIHNNSFSVAATPITSLLPPSVNIGGFGTLDYGITFPYAGTYSVAMGGYYSGGGAATYSRVGAQWDDSGSWAELFSAAAYFPGTDIQIGNSVTGLLAKKDKTIRLAGSTSAAPLPYLYGDGITRRTFLSVTYEGPAYAS